MIIQVSEKHATGDYGKKVEDSKIPEGEIFHYIPYAEYLTVRNGSNVAYIKQDCMTEYPYGLDNSHSFPKNTVITFTQDTLS